MARFWWSGNLDKRSLHWTVWDKLAVPKEKGGVGFRDVHAFNIALHKRQGWRLITCPHSLCAQVLKGRHYPDRDFMEASASRAASRMWRAILAGRSALSLGLIKSNEAGDTLSIWRDNRIPMLHTLRPVEKLIDGESAHYRRSPVGHGEGQINIFGTRCGCDLADPVESARRR
jgi:hypothetical protein